MSKVSIYIIRAIFITLDRGDMDGAVCDLSFSELRCKEVINTADGRRLGRIVDMIFSSCGEIRGIIVPYCRRVFFARSQEVFIPFKCIDCIGEDVILVCLKEEGFCTPPFKGGRGGRGPREYRPPHDDPKGGPNKGGRGGGRGSNRGGVFVHSCEPDSDNCDNNEGYHTVQDDCDPPQGMPNCDRKCEKCMLFDCGYRWKT